MRHINESQFHIQFVRWKVTKLSLFSIEHMIVDLVEKTIERDQEARQVKEVKEKLFGRMGAVIMGISPLGCNLAAWAKSGPKWVKNGQSQMTSTTKEIKEQEKKWF